MSESKKKLNILSTLCIVFSSNSSPSSPHSLCNPGNRADPRNCTQGGFSQKVGNWKLLKRRRMGIGSLLQLMYIGNGHCGQNLYYYDSFNWRRIMCPCNPVISNTPLNNLRAKAIRLQSSSPRPELCPVPACACVCLRVPECAAQE